MLVLKFGGTSVGSSNAINLANKIIIDYYATHKNIVVVCSAMATITDMLQSLAISALNADILYKSILIKLEKAHLKAAKPLLAKKLYMEYTKYIHTQLSHLDSLCKGIFLLKELSPRVMDIIFSHGELFNNKLIYLLLSQSKIPVRFLDPTELICTDNQYNNAKVDFETTNRNFKISFKSYKGISILPGFIGGTMDGTTRHTTTLGRGGSDYTAAIAGAALQASHVIIYTDVDGVHTADPRKVKKTIPISDMTYSEAMEMSYFGAKVIYPPTIIPLYNKRIPLYIKNTFNTSTSGTRISHDIIKSDYIIRGISSIDSISLLTLSGSGMIGVSGTAARLFNALASEHINVILITQSSSEHSITFAIDPKDQSSAIKKLEREFKNEIAQNLILPIQKIEQASIMAIIGENMHHTPGVSARLFQALARHGINIIATAQGSSELNISIVLDRSQLNKALEVTHQSFFHKQIKVLNIFLVGTGLIGSTLLKQIHENASYLLDNLNLQLRLIGIANSRKMHINADGLPWNMAKSLIDNNDLPSLALDKLLKKIIQLNLPHTVFVDCTSTDVVSKYYTPLLDHAISIVTPNKIANSLDYYSYQALRHLAAKRNVKFLYETNVGAGLPIIKTLNELQHSGDKIIKIEAVLSGTLSFLFNNYDGSTTFAQTLLKAQKAGYTEPDPRDDLNLLDFARKMLILARESGLPIEMKDIDLKLFITDKMLKAKTVKDFYTELEEENNYFQNIVDSAKKQNKKLCVIGRLLNNKATISLQMIDSNHPFFSLDGSDNIIAFTTSRYNTRPLVIKGPGAGADVTAAGVYADIISISNYLEGNTI